MPTIDTEVNLVLNTMTEDILEGLEASSSVPPNQVFFTDEDDDSGYIGLPVGSIFTSSIGIDDARYHILDGSLISQTGVYSEFAQYLKQQMSKGLVGVCSQSDFDADVLRTGNCGKFVIDDTNRTIRLPKITNFIQGLTNLTNIGSSLEAGLPNITGLLRQDGINSDSGFGAVWGGDGAFYVADSTNNVATYNGSGTYRDVRHISFDASRSSAVYGNSNTVQPSSTMYPYYIVLANSYLTDIEIDINKILADLSDYMTLNTEQTIRANKTFNDNIGLRSTTGSMIKSDGTHIHVGNRQQNTRLNGLNERPDYANTTGTTGIALVSDINAFSMAPSEIIESLSLTTSDIRGGNIIYTATRNCICSLRWGSSTTGYWNCDIFNKNGGFCFSFVMQATINYDTNTVIFPLSTGMFIRIEESTNNVNINWCNLQICATEEI